MNKHQEILRRVGLVLILAGIVDIAVMVYCIIHGITYASPFNVFAVIAGIFLVRGNLRVAGAVIWLTTFLFVLFLGAPFLLVLLQPLDFTLLQIRLFPVGSTLSAVLWLFAMALLMWTLLSLKNVYLEDMTSGARKKRHSLRIPIVLGLLLLAAFAVILSISFNGEAARLAKSKVSEQLGSNYKYFVSSLQVSYSPRGEHITAVVTAYNDNEFRKIPLQLDK